MSIGWQEFFRELESLLNEFTNRVNESNEAYCEYAIGRCDIAIRSISGVELNAGQLLRGETEPEDREQLQTILLNSTLLLSSLRNISLLWEERLEVLSVDPPPRSPPLTARRLPGRPSFAINPEQVLLLVEMSFSWVQISRLLGISRQTLWRRRILWGMHHIQNTTISDEELGSIIQTVRQNHPQMGETITTGIIHSITGCRVSRRRIRRSIRVVDPLFTSLRWRNGLVTRRPYSVRGPNALWHIDGHHKLVRWRFVVHAGIDGYSRLVTYMRCSTDNRAATVYRLFIDAVRHYGLPRRVRCDQGRENIRVAEHMIQYQGSNRGSILVGSSVHNQRIERLWRDMHRCTTSVYYRLFYHLEQTGLLNPLNNHHLFALHYVYLPRINQSLDIFCDGWNNHRLRSEHHWTPLQLFTAGVIEQESTETEDAEMDLDQLLDYGVEEAGIAPARDDEHDEGVPVPSVNISLTESQLENLRNTVDPLAESDSYGIDLYRQTLTFIQ
jgi:hypothetical protein